MFWSGKAVSENMRDWIFDCFEWFDEHFEPPALPIIPTKAYFDAPKGVDIVTATKIVEDLKRHLNITHATEVSPLGMVGAEHRHEYQSLSSVAGAHQQIGDTSVIRYDPELLNQPIAFINTMAHELMHARLAGIETMVPGGAEAHELATDLGCIIAGLGIFQLQAADDLGWTGYMSQPTRAFALAVFLDRRGLEIDCVAPYLSSRCRKLLARAIKDVSLS